MAAWKQGVDWSPQNACEGFGLSEGWQLLTGGEQRDRPLAHLLFRGQFGIGGLRQRPVSQTSHHNSHFEWCRRPRPSRSVPQDVFSCRNYSELPSGPILFRLTKDCEGL